MNESEVNKYTSNQQFNNDDGFKPLPLDQLSLLTSFFSLLIQIDQRIKKEGRLNEETKIKE